ncbi:hypothetical protein yc1106_02282 [Curvularia clavata]|uniref:Uncharacterized protein n=1 Tax=Curvularia clavata TaxID=95742 RepID=A0A9Q9DPC4_CURCL|nr:hypothetical protein yc1106_02282 [Curvularia clavata]
MAASSSIYLLLLQNLLHPTYTDVTQVVTIVMSTSADSLTLSELDKAQEKLLRAKRKSTRFSRLKQSLDKEEEQLEEQKRCLATKRSMLLGQYRDWVDTTLNHGTIIPYCKAWNQNFATQLQNRFPREIRNMVYKHLWYFDPDRTSAHLQRRLHVLQHYTFTCMFCTPDTMAIFPRLIDIAQCLVQVDHEKLREFFDRSLLPHYLSPEYVGFLTAHEVGVSFYLSICTEDLLHCQSHRISPVLQDDALHLGLPKMDLVTSLTVHCKVDRYRTPPPDHKLSAKCKHSLSETTLVRKDALKQDFSALLDIKKKQGFKLHVIMHQRNIRLTVLEEAMEALEELFHSFQQNGASLRVT